MGKKTDLDVMIKPLVIKTQSHSHYYRDVPNYLTNTYDWAYVNPKNVNRLDHESLVWILLFFNAGRLMSRYLNEIEPGMRVWQVAHVYGTLVQKVAEKVGKEGVFHLTDCTPIQLEHAQKKLDHFSNTTIINSDAATYITDEPFDIVCSFMLLHEVPDTKKTEIIDRMLTNLKPNGKAIFVDYHKPKLYWQPFRSILQLVNRYLEPYSDALWQNEIESYATHKDDYHWEKETIFGGVYQFVLVTKKEWY